MKNRSGRSGRKFGPLVGATLKRAGLHRALRGESLEARHMMAGDVYQPFHNDLIPEDTNGDYTVSAIDALLVINAINSGQSGQLVGPGIGKADGPRLDVTGDNALSALDALRIVNRINGEGEDPPIVGFRFELTDTQGNPLNQGQAGVGQLVQLKSYVRDLRGFDADGIFAAFLDVDYTNGDKFQVNVGEVQSFRYDFDKLSITDTNSSFRFTFNTSGGPQTTAPISLFNGDSPRSDAEVAAAIEVALQALPGIGVGNVIVRRDAVGSSQDQADNRKRNSYDIIFVNNMAGKDVALLTLDASNVKLVPNSTFVFTLQDKLPADPNNSASVAAAFQFSNEFANSREASLGTNQFDEVGAVGGLGAPVAPGAERLFFTVTLKTIAPGVVTFTPNAAEEFPAHETLVFPKDVVPTNLINYGNPFNLVIASSVTAINDTFTLAEDANTAQFNVTTNDSISSGTSFVITGVTASTAGVTPTISADGKKVNYKPTANFFGPDTFTYTITNNLGASATATVTMTVTPVNDPITVPNQAVSTRVNTPATFTVDDLTVNGNVGPGESIIQQLRIASATSPTAKGGTVALNGGSVVYTPAANSGTADSFTIVVTDDGQTNGVLAASTRTVTVNVTLLNDAPVAVNDLIDTVDEDTTNNTLNVLANDSPGANDTNDSLVITATGGTPAGTVAIGPNGLTLIYTPVPGTVGQDTFTYTVRDLAGATSTASVTVDVQATVLPRARIDVGNTSEDSATGVLIDVLLNDRISDNATDKVLLSVNAPAKGTAVIEAGQVRYVPNANFSGTDTFTYVMNQSPNPGFDSIGTVSITVVAVNDPPVLVNETVSANEDETVTISTATLLNNDSPGLGETDQQSLSVTAVQAVTAGAGSVALSGGNVIYTPAANFNGDFVFTYTATDTGSPALSGTATVTISIADVNDAPVVGNNTSSTTEDSAKTIQATELLANDLPGPASATDEAGQTLTIVSVGGSSAQGGTVTLAGDGGAVTYTPALNFFGTDTFTYTARDTGTPALQSTATVTITVTAVNDVPVAGPDTVTAFKGVPLTIVGASLLTNDQPGPANESNQTLSITQVSGATNGTVSLGANGQIVFTPNAGYTGPASFTYTVTDNGQTNGVADPRTATGTVNVTVQEFIPSNVTGTVYVDETGNGIIDTAERRLGGVTVSLVGTAFGQSISQSTVTLADGTYQFGQLAPGTYTISFVNPAMMIDGKDTAGDLGDSDGIQNNNTFTFAVASPGGIDASGYNFAVNGVSNGYGTLMEKLASRYYAAGSTLANYGLYAAVDSNGSQTWFANLDGFSGVVYAEATLINTGSQVLLTIIDSAHDVFTAVLGKGKFVSLHDGLGNTIIRVLGGREQLNFVKVEPSMYSDSVDEVFSQEGW